METDSQSSGLGLPSADIICLCLHTQLFLWILIAKVLEEKAGLSLEPRREASSACVCLTVEGFSSHTGLGHCRAH